MRQLFDLDNWREIFETLLRNKSRSLLTAFGIFWGIFMLIVLMGGGKGMKTIFQHNFKGVAQNSCFISSNTTTEPYDGLKAGRQWHLTTDDVKNIKRYIPEIDIVSPICINFENVTYGSTTRSYNIRGVKPNYNKVQVSTIRYGRILNNNDELQQSKVCVLGYQVATTLFGSQTNPCGYFISIGGISFQIVGVLSNDANISIGGDIRSSISIPLTTYQRIHNTGKNIDVLAITIRPGHSVAEMESKIHTFIKSNHRIAPSDEYAINYFNLEQMFQIIERLLVGVNFLIWLIGIGTILGGVVGVTNIMLVTIRERTSEIGIRRAIGAKRKDIITQIMAESIVLTITAGLSGISLAVGLLEVINNIVAKYELPQDFQISFIFAITAVAALLLLGIIAGLAPTHRALSIKPIDAIREE